MTNGRPASPEAIRKGIAHYSSEEVGDLFTIGQKGSIVGSLDKACGGKEGRYAVLFWLFPGKWEQASGVTTKKLTNSEWWALYRWIRPYRDEHLNRWTYDQNANEEIRWIMDHIAQENTMPIQSVMDAPQSPERPTGSAGKAVGQ